ncbi:MAG: MFS transporter [Mariprofundaceae bacterium]|nr:MFS transporter [Mariprofundaceae bacterium]
MNSLERQGTFSLAGIYALRMLGLFMILPVFSLYAEGLEGVTPMLIGLALGIYGLTMALFQIPFGILSDRFGRKPIITIGLLLFAIGSVVAASSDSIMGVIIGRAIQGAGAIAAAMMALLADLTREEHRTKAMAIMGVSIGMSFTLALVLGPFLSNIFGVAGIFWLTAVLAIAGIGVLYLIVPEPEHCHVHRDAETVPAQLKQVISDGQLLRLDLGIMIQHAIMMAMFTALPFVLRDFLGLPSEEHAWFYLPVLVLSVFGMVPLIIIAEKKQKMKEVFLICVSLMVLAECMLGLYHDSLFAVGVGMLLFFIAFNALEASLPSLISRMAPVDGKGTAMGVYSTSQFFGAFVGGSFGGIAYGAFGVQGVFYACAIAALIWVVIAVGMRVPAYLSNHMVHLDEALLDDGGSLADRLLSVTGVHEAKVVIEDSTAYLRIDKQKFNPEDLDKVLG